jgi:hypothetical protein
VLWFYVDEWYFVEMDVLLNVFEVVAGTTFLAGEVAGDTLSGDPTGSTPEVMPALAGGLSLGTYRAATSFRNMELSSADDQLSIFQI